MQVKKVIKMKINKSQLKSFWLCGSEIPSLRSSSADIEGRECAHHYTARGPISPARGHQGVEEEEEKQEEEEEEGREEAGR